MVEGLVMAHRIHHGAESVPVPNARFPIVGPKTPRLLGQECPGAQCQFPHCWTQKPQPSQAENLELQAEFLRISDMVTGTLPGARWHYLLLILICLDLVWDTVKFLISSHPDTDRHADKRT